MIVAEKASVLLVDDDQDVLDALAELLSGEGFVISEARNGREAWDLLRGAPPPSLILLDLMMPVMSGLEFLDRKSRDRDLAPIPVVIISGISVDPPADLPIIRKPFDPDSVVDAVRLHIGMRPRSQTSGDYGV
jgi:CheY-like chemotaxis protein